MAKVRVPIHRTSPTQSVLIDPAATVGAQVGVNLLDPDGKLVPWPIVAPATGGSSLNTTDDLDEGQWNLWFTDIRAQDAVGGILVDTATIDFTYTAGTSITADLKDLADSGTGAALVKLTRDAKGRLSGTSSATTTDLTEGVNLYFTDARADARITLQKAQPLGLATLDAGGKLDAGQLPALAITETFVVNTQAAMLALAAEEGDVAVRTDLSQSFILTTAPASTLANWQELLTPASPVTSIFGRVGSVTAATGDYTFAQIGSTPTTLAGYGITDALATITPAGYIDGAKMVWNSGTSLSLTSGAMYIQSLAKVVQFPSLLTLSGLSLTASTWYHLYGYLNAGTPAILLSTTAPAAAYSGTARSMTGDTSKRYIGTVLTDASGNLYNFQQSNDRISYNTNLAAAPFTVLSAGRATASTNVSCTGSVPITAKIASLLILNSDTSQVVYFANTATGAVSTTNFLSFVFNPGTATADYPVGTNQSLNYMYPSTPAGACFIRVVGYIYER
ncbi:hypothetical protein EAH88_11905 [Rhodanobacter glycinis]|uniref:Uncharacterized protein n=1 Tax=Rhodanobacter glycinis TaxID=582702 RepID=A0A502C5Z2_9GAMM|nr:hypothetical protein [Rhodanobacter glycinis]TPG08328.1 hypothetical protein EAH88_11905 [Rhodanobacter glycinis]